VIFAAVALAAIAATIDVGERASLMMISLKESGASERLLRLADVSLRAHSRLAVKSPEQLGIDSSRLLDCELDRRLSCWVREARGVGADAAVYLLAISVVPSGEITVLLIDLDRARTLAGENEIFETVITVRASNVKLAEDAALSALFDELFARRFAEVFEARGLRSLPGAIELAVDRAGLSIALDGRVVGSTSTQAIVLSSVAAGLRRISLREAESEVLSREVEVRPASVARVELVLRPPDHTLRSVALIGGGAAVVGGLATGTIAFIGRGERITPCVGAATCEVSPRLVPGVAVGLGIVVFGAVWAIGALAAPDEDLYFWLSLGLGVALGGATVALGL
jgi:hypothetical protein